MLLKKKRCQSILLVIKKFLLILMEKILMKKILTKKIKYRMCLVFIFSKTLNEENVIIYKTFLVIQKILI